MTLASQRLPSQYRWPQPSQDIAVLRKQPFFHPSPLGPGSSNKFLIPKRVSPTASERRGVKGREGTDRRVDFISRLGFLDDDRDMEGILSFLEKRQSYSWKVRLLKKHLVYSNESGGYLQAPAQLTNSPPTLGNPLAELPLHQKSSETYGGRLDKSCSALWVNRMDLRWNFSLASSWPRKRTPRLSQTPRSALIRSAT